MKFAWGRFALVVAPVLAPATFFFVRSDDAFVLAKRGRPAECSIVLPASPTPVQAYAASELQAFVRRLTDVSLPIVGPDEKKLSRTVEICDGGIENPKCDGFRLKVEGSCLQIIASASRGGSLYGVYELLERFGGCRWYASWCERIPRLGQLAVPRNLDEVQEPAFEMRLPYWYDVLQHHDFAARLRVNSHQWGSMEPQYGGEQFRFDGKLGNCHTFDALVPISEYGRSHPEYFAFRDGRRWSDVSGREAQLCLSNPNVLEIVVSNVLRRIRKDPSARFYGVSQNDNTNYCQCEKCAAIDAEEGSHAGTVVRFVNAVAERVEKEYPDVVIETLAYQFSRNPPKKTRLRENVMPCLCSIECDFSQAIPESPARANKSFCEDLHGWRAMTESVYLWDYTTDFSHYLMPFGNVLSLQGNIRFFRNNGVKYLYEEGDSRGRHASFAELKTWLLAKWMWNPELPMEGLLNDFFSGYYGKGAPFVRAYFDELHRLQREWSENPNRPLGVFANTDLGSLTDEFLQRAADLFDRAAMATVDDSVCNYNVRMSSLSVDYLRLQRLCERTPLLVFDPAWAGGEEGALRQKLAASVLARMDDAKDIRLALKDEKHDRIVSSWRQVLAGFPRFLKDGRGELEEHSLKLENPGVSGNFADDVRASDGKALKLFGTHYDWCATFPMSKIVFKAGEKYTLSVRLRVDPKEGTKGESFWAGVYDPVGKTYPGGILSPKISEIGPGYCWYDVATWEPRPTDYFWIGPGRFDRRNHQISAVEFVWIDKIAIRKSVGR